MAAPKGLSRTQPESKAMTDIPADAPVAAVKTAAKTARTAAKRVSAKPKAKVKAAASTAKKSLKAEAGVAPAKVAELRTSAAELRIAAAARTVAAKKWAEGQAEVAKEWAADTTEHLRDTVQERPLTSVGIGAGAAFAAGLVLGVLLVRR